MNNVQVLLYTSYLHIIGGIETFVFSFVNLMSEYYDIGVYCPQIPVETQGRLSQKVPVFTKDVPISCNTLIMIRIMDDIPKNVTYKKSIRMCHATKSTPAWYIKQDCDKIIHVSQASKESFDSDGDIIYNPVIKTKKEALLLVSATRIPARDKGKNADRMLELAKMLSCNGIPFLWFNFSDAPLNNAPKGFVNVGSFQDLQPYIAKADYLVQLSDQEGFGYSVAEALANNTAVICTPFSTTAELGVKNGENGYIIPYNMRFDVKKLLNVPKFTYEYDNSSIIAKWKKQIGNLKPKHDYIPPKELLVRVTTEYRDIELKKMMKPGEIIRMKPERVDEILKVGNLVEVLED